MTDYREQQEAEAERIQMTLEALEAAERAGTPHEFIVVLAYEAGVGSIYQGGRK